MATQESKAVHRVIVERDLPMRTRDGVALYADVYRPDATGRFPVLVVRTPYDKSQEMALTEKDYFPSRGYVVVVQDTRGRFRSEGEFIPSSTKPRTATIPLNGPPRCPGPTATWAQSGSPTSDSCNTSPRPNGRRT